ncbi:MAG: hypothetical protein ACYTGQ_16855, partial [Planctomycetota bacterium]
MTRLARHLDSATEPDLLTRCASLGIALLCVDGEGAVLTRHPAANPETGSPIDAALFASPLLEAALCAAAPRWNDQPRPEPLEAWPGCWLIPIPAFARRQRNGYLVALALTDEWVNAEQFAALCDWARLDRHATASIFAKRGARRAVDVPVLARTLNWMAGDLDRLARQDFELDDLSAHVADTYEELSLVYKLSANMTVTQDPGAFLQDACEEIQQVIGFGWVAMQLTDTDVRLKELGGRFLQACLGPARQK